MNKLILIFTFILITMSTLFAQDKKTIYIDGFKRGSSNINDIASGDLIELSNAIADTNLIIIFYGLTDAAEWKNSSKSVSDVLNAGLRLNRAMAFFERFKRGFVQVGYENFRGVKVVLKQRRTQVQKIQNIKEIHEHQHNNYYSEESDLDIGFQIGYWTSNVFEDKNTNLRFDDLYHAPYISIIVSKNKLSVLGKYGMYFRRSGHSSETGRDALGKKFGYIGIIYNLNDTFGISSGVHRAWEVVLHTDEWETRQSAINLGLVITIGKFELNPALNYSHLDDLTPTLSETWKPGVSISVGFNFLN